MEVSEELLLGEALHDQLWPVLTAGALTSLRLTRGERCDPASDSTRLGGWPLLAPGAPWPRTAAGQALCLIGQWNTDEINAWLDEPSLPCGHVLAFFYEAVAQNSRGLDPDLADHWRVVATPLAEATPIFPPVDAITFRSFPLGARRVLTVPDRHDPALDGLDEQEAEAVSAVYRKLAVDGDDSPRHRAFGWPDPQRDAMPPQCQLASHGIRADDPQPTHDPRAEALRAGAGDWILLWQVDTDAEAGWSWGDTGTLYYWIRRQDLAEAAFDRVWLMLQSG